MSFLTAQCVYFFLQEAGAENKFLAEDTVSQSPNGIDQKR